jgi:hypothetical protein
MKSYPVERQLRPGEVVREGDVMVYNHGQSRIVVRRCKYDPGCCVGHVVEENDDYRRSIEEKP